MKAYRLKGWDFLGNPVVKTFAFQCRGLQVQSLVEELRFHLPLVQKAKTENRSKIVTNSIKTLKIAHIKKVFKKFIGKKKKDLRSEEAQSILRTCEQGMVW